MPEEPSVLTNLGLSYVLTNDLPKAEETLRRALSKAETDLRVRANLALAVGLQGRMAEAESIVKVGLSEEQTRASVAYLKRLLSQRENAQANADRPSSRQSGRPN